MNMLKRKLNICNYKTDAKLVLMTKMQNQI